MSKQDNKYLITLECDRQKHTHHHIQQKLFEKKNKQNGNTVETTLFEHSNPVPVTFIYA